MNKITNNEKAYKIMMKRISRQLKSISDYNTKKEIEKLLTGSTTYGAFKWQEELIGEMKLYITYLGYIDSLILDINRDTIFFSKFEDQENKLSELKSEYENLVKKRSKVVSLIKENTNICKDLDFADRVISEIPSIHKFKLVYDDMEINEYRLNLQLEFINAYNAGYTQRGYVNSECIDILFERYQKEVTEHRNNNKRLVAINRLLKS